MSRPRRSDRPIREVKLDVRIEADPLTISGIREETKAPKGSPTALEVSMKGRSPGRVAEETRLLFEAVKLTSVRAKGSTQKAGERS